MTFKKRCALKIQAIINIIIADNFVLMTYEKNPSKKTEVKKVKSHG